MIEAERRHARKAVNRVVAHRVQPRRGIVVRELCLSELQPVPRAPVVFLSRIVRRIVLQQIDEQRDGFVVALEVAQRLRAAELHLRLEACCRGTREDAIVQRQCIGVSRVRKCDVRQREQNRDAVGQQLARAGELAKGAGAICRSGTASAPVSRCTSPKPVSWPMRSRAASAEYVG